MTLPHGGEPPACLEGKECVMDTSKELETQRLETANRHIIAMEERIEMQRRRVAKLKRQGVCRGESEKLLSVLLELRRYRQQVINHLVQIRIEQGLQRRILQAWEFEQ